MSASRAWSRFDRSPIATSIPCSSAFYSRKSENAKGRYIYYQCGTRQRRGPDACANKTSLREDHLLEDLRVSIREILLSSGELIARATELARQEITLYEDHTARIRAELSEVRGKVGRLTELLLDPDITREAKPVLSGQLAQAGGSGERRGDPENGGCDE